MLKYLAAHKFFSNISLVHLFFNLQDKFITHFHNKENSLNYVNNIRKSAFCSNFPFEKQQSAQKNTVQIRWTVEECGEVLTNSNNHSIVSLKSIEADTLLALTYRLRISLPEMGSNLAVKVRYTLGSRKC